ncbi:Aldo/keto reductase [Marasmius fiardii PR-910]|nr:Aldo/keto reductase [Marasmius fiardii PR-910]
MPESARYRQLGSSGLKVSVPILGTMSFGSPDWAPWVLPEEPSLEILKAAWDLGINTIDTANIYSEGESERIIAVFMEKYKIPRNQIVIATKCYGVVGESPGVRAHLHPELKKERLYVNQFGLSRASIFNAVEASLQRLKTSYIDLLQIHRFDPDVPAEETMKALHDLVENGKVRYIGASSMRAWQFAHLNEVAARNGWTKFVSMQNEYSLLYREDEREMLAYCKFNGIGVIPWGPLCAGVLARPLSSEKTTRSEASHYVHTEADKAIISRVEELAKAYGTSMARITLAWVSTKVTSPIVGISSIQRLGESLLGGLKLAESDIKYLEEPYVPKPVRNHA